MSLQEYVRKRDFRRTREPRGAAKTKGSRAARFVIQKHDASRLHYDFRLELGGTLKSWAVPKGVPFAKGEKRLAVHVEDHPIEYAGFEGVIPKGQYGGGTVMVWDNGTWEGLGSDDPQKDLDEGKLHFAMQGKKLVGEWTLVRIGRGEGDEWLLIKSGESIKTVSKKLDDSSVLTARTMAKIASDRDAEWQSNREDEPKPKRNEKALPRLGFLEPMKAKLAAEPPRAGDWIYELKFDGYRAVALKSGAAIELLSRNHKDLAGHFPEITKALEGLRVKSAIFDGEIVALDPESRPSFQLLQALETGSARPPLVYYLFDLLHLDGEDLRGESLEDRKHRLQTLLRGAGEPLRFSANIEGDPRRLLEEVRARGLEGIIGKQRESVYESGVRSGAWIKLKCVNEQEFVIGGSTPPQGTRKHFGALLVGYFQRGKLRFAGKVGTGFDTALLSSIQGQLDRLKRATCPFADLPEKQGGRWTQNITPAEMRRCRWAEPRLVCQVKFADWTRDAKLRQPVFLGLREDKDASSVVRERAAIAPS